VADKCEGFSTRPSESEYVSNFISREYEREDLVRERSKVFFITVDICRRYFKPNTIASTEIDTNQTEHRGFQDFILRGKPARVSSARMFDGSGGRNGVPSAIMMKPI